MCVGASTEYTGLFKQQRDAHLCGIVVETNRLVIRLEKVCRSSLCLSFVEMYLLYLL